MANRQAISFWKSRSRPNYASIRMACFRRHEAGGTEPAFERLQRFPYRLDGPLLGPVEAWV